MGARTATTHGGRSLPRRLFAIGRSPGVVLGVVRVADLLTVFVAGVAAYVAWHRGLWPDEPYYLALILGVLVSAQIFQLSRVYAFGMLSQPFRQLARLLPALVAVGAVLLTVAFFVKQSDYYSRGWAALWLIFAALGLCALRIDLARRLVRWQAAGLLSRTAVVIGAGDRARRLIEHVNALAAANLKIAGLFDDRRGRVPRDILGVPVIGAIEDLPAYSRKNPVDLIIIALPWSAEARLGEIMNLTRTVPADVQLLPDLVGFHLVDRGVTHLGGVPMLTVFERPFSGWNYVLKGVEDRLLAVLILAVFAPFMLAIAAAIKLSSPGPVLFRQERYGFNNKVFSLLKFRTMYDHPPEEHEVPQARRDDPRVTRVGAFLRRTSLDELPQLFNVLRGEMSVVGPRPHAVPHNEEYAKNVRQYYARHRVKPGITGWAQIHGFRGATDTPEKLAKRVQYDLFYIDNWSLLLDLRILVMTLFVGFVNRNAY